MATRTDKNQSKIIQEGIISLVLASDIKSVPPNVYYLSGLVREKKQILLNVCGILVQLNIFFQSDYLDETRMCAKQILLGILRSHPETAQVDIFKDRKLRDASFMVEKLLRIAVCMRYSGILTKHLLHMEFLDDQISWLADEIEQEAHPYKKPPSEHYMNSLSEGGRLLLN
jgi:hypothetical protein